MNIYLPVEIKSRELEGKLLLGLAAAERGHMVILGEKSHTRGLAAKGILPPGILHNKSLTPSAKALKLLDNLKNQNHIITCQDEEGGLIDESYEPFARLRFSEKSIQKTDRVFGWGNHDTEALKELFAGSEKKFAATGSPRVDFWRKDMQAYYDLGPVSEKAKSLKPFILISSNFSSFLNQNRFFDVLARLRQANYFDRNPEWEQYQYDNFAYQAQLIFEFIKLIRRLSSELDGMNILVRPHPVESVEGWKKALGSYPNVNVIREGAIGNWLKECKLLVHNGCTTAIEAAAFGIPRIAFRPIPDPIEREIPNSISFQAFSVDEVFGFMDTILENSESCDEGKVDEVKNKILTERFANIEGALAADRMIDEWEKFESHFDNSQASADELIERKNTYYAEKKSMSKNLKQMVARLIRKGNDDQNKSNKVKLDNSHKFPSFTDEEYHRIKQDISRALNRFGGVTYRRLGEKTILLFSK